MSQTTFVCFYSFIELDDLEELASAEMDNYHFSSIIRIISSATFAGKTQTIIDTYAFCLSAYRFDFEETK